MVSSKPLEQRVSPSPPGTQDLYLLPTLPSSSRFAKYYRDLTGNEQRTLTKAYGIRFDIIVFGKVGPPLNPAWRESLPLPPFLSSPPSQHSGSPPVFRRPGSLTSSQP